MPIPSTLNKCQPTALTPPPRYKAPKRHFLPNPLSRTPPRSSTPQSSQRRARSPHHYRVPRDLRLITALGLIALTIVYSLALIQIGIATAPKPCSHSGSGLKHSGSTTQNTDVTLEGSVSQDFQKQRP